MDSDPLEFSTSAAVKLGVSEADAKRGTEIAQAVGAQHTRFFHNAAHFTNLARGSLEIQDKLKNCGIGQETAALLANVYSLAGRDHDIVYINADKQIAEPALEYVAPFVEKQDGAYNICSEEKIAQLPEQARENLRIAMTAFGYKPGDMLSLFNGQNEFLSTLYSLQINTGLAPSTKAMVAGLIQSTIPFDKADSVQAMAARISELGTLTTEQTHALGLAAADFANRDVSAFAGPADKFHIGTCNLIRENGTNFDDAEALIGASGRVINFFEFLLSHGDAKPVFRNYSFTNESGQTISLPSAQEVEVKNAYARQQIEIDIGKLKEMQATGKSTATEGEPELPNTAGVLPASASKIVSLHEERRGTGTNL